MSSIRLSNALVVLQQIQTAVKSVENGDGSVDGGDIAAKAAEVSKTDNIVGPALGALAGGLIQKETIRKIVGTQQVEKKVPADLLLENHSFNETVTKLVTVNVYQDFLVDGYMKLDANDVRNIFSNAETKLRDAAGQDGYVDQDELASSLKTLAQDPQQSGRIVKSLLSGLSALAGHDGRAGPVG